MANFCFKIQKDVYLPTQTHNDDTIMKKIPVAVIELTMRRGWMDGQTIFRYDGIMFAKLKML